MQSEILQAQLLALAEPSYKEFVGQLLPGVDNLLGVRLPQLRRLARELAKGDWQGYLATAKSEYFEEIMLQGMVIGLAEADANTKLNLTRQFIPQISNWSVCDSFCSSFKLAKQEPELVWQFVKPYLQAEKTYEVRFAVVMLLHYYIEQRYIDEVLPLLATVSQPDYYVKMAVAWALAACYAKFPQMTLPYLEADKLPAATYKQALQKIVESRQVDEASKLAIRQIRQQSQESSAVDRAAVVYETAIGRLGIIADATAVIKLVFDPVAAESGGSETALHRRAISEIRAYLAGELTDFTVPVKLHGTPFQQAVWQALQLIPYGGTRCYKDIANAIGKPKACRAVGMANNRNPLPLIIPCHRVIGADGSLVGYAGGLNIKKQLLDIEQCGGKQNDSAL